jgi:hypothetical protein
MEKRFLDDRFGPVDLYYNDSECLQNSLKCIKNHHFD